MENVSFYKATEEQAKQGIKNNQPIPDGSIIFTDDKHHIYLKESKGTVQYGGGGGDDVTADFDAGRTVGGITSGTSLKDKTALEILKTMLQKERIKPTPTYPNFTFNVTPNIIAINSTPADLTITFNNSNGPKVGNIETDAPIFNQTTYKFAIGNIQKNISDTDKLNTEGILKVSKSISWNANTTDKIVDNYGENSLTNDGTFNNNYVDSSTYTLKGGSFSQTKEIKVRYPILYGNDLQNLTAILDTKSNINVVHSQDTPFYIAYQKNKSIDVKGYNSFSNQYDATIDLMNSDKSFKNNYLVDESDGYILKVINENAYQGKIQIKFIN